MTTTLQQYPLLTRNFDTIVADQSATLAASLSTNSAIFDSLNLVPGSPILAIIEANAGVQLLMQYLALRVLRSTRLATASGADLDSFGADFLFARFSATAATGQVLLNRATAANLIYIPLNTLIRTADGSQSFTVIAPQIDPANVYDPTLGYAMNPNVYSISVLVQAVTPGSIGNIAANTLTRVSSSSLPVTATNPGSFINGADAASDDAFRSAFSLYIRSRDNATLTALQNAIATTNINYTYSILENNPYPGSILIYFDDGTGFPSQNRQIELQNNIEKVRGAAITPFVVAANPISLIIQCQTTFPSSALKLSNIRVLHDAIASYVNSLAVGQNLLTTKLYQIMYDACPAMTEVFNLILNAVDVNGNALVNNPLGDVIVNAGQVLRFIPNPPLVNGFSSIRPSVIVID